MVLGPVRAAWSSDRPAWVPVLASATFGYAVLTFMTQFAQPLIWPEASADFSRSLDGTDVYVMDADGSHQTRLTRAEGQAEQDRAQDGEAVAARRPQPASLEAD